MAGLPKNETALILEKPDALGWWGTRKIEEAHEHILCNHLEMTQQGEIE